MDETLHFDDEFLLRYLDGELSQQERNLMEERLSRDEALRERFNSLNLARQAIQFYGTSHTVRSLHHQMMKEVQPVKPGKLVVLSKWTKYAIGIAASILIVFLVSRGFNSPNPGPGELYQIAFVDFDASGNRGSAPVNEIQNGYQLNDHASVITNNELAVNQHDSLLVALSYLKTGNTRSSIAWLQPLTTHGTYRQDAEFYMGLAYLKQRDYNHALQIARKIHSDPSHLYHSRMDAGFIDKLEKLTRD